MYEEAYERLCYAVIRKAVQDYRIALKILKKRPKDSIALRDKKECESFFENEMELYTNLDGKTLARKIREKVEAEFNG